MSRQLHVIASMPVSLSRRAGLHIRCHGQNTKQAGAAQKHKQLDARRDAKLDALGNAQPRVAYPSLAAAALSMHSRGGEWARTRRSEHRATHHKSRTRAETCHTHTHTHTHFWRRRERIRQVVDAEQRVSGGIRGTERLSTKNFRRCSPARSGRCKAPGRQCRSGRGERGLSPCVPRAVQGSGRRASPAERPTRRQRSGDPGVAAVASRAPLEAWWPRRDGAPAKVRPTAPAGLPAA